MANSSDSHGQRRHHFFHSGKSYIVFISITILGVYLALIALLNYFNYTKSITSLTNTRFMVIADDVIQSIEYGVNLGLSLNEIKTIRSLVTEAGERNTDIKNIVVFDDKGLLLVHSKPGEKKISSDLITLIRKTNIDTIKNLIIGDAYVIIFPIKNQFDIKVGYLALSYPSELLQTPLRKALFRFTIYFLLVTFICAVIIVIVLNMLYRGLSDSLKKIETSLRSIKNGPEDRRTDENTLLGPAFSEFYSTTSGLMEELGKLERECELIEMK